MSPMKIFFAAAPLSLFLAAQALGQCEAQRLVPPPQETAGRFGHQLQMNDRHLVVGDFQGDSPCAGICSTGVVYAYGRDPDTGAWRQNQIIAPTDIGLGGAFGYAVHLDGDRMIVGATYADLTGGDTGAAYIYGYEEGEWVETGRLVSPHPHFGSEFGRAVYLQGGLAIVVQYVREGVFVYEETPSGWLLRDALEPPVDPGGATFGDAIALTDEWLFLGAHYDRTAGTHAGSVYVYRRTGPTNFEFLYKMYPPDPETRPQFGSDIAIEGDTLIISGPTATGSADGQGAVYCYELEAGEWVFRQRLTHEPMGRNNFFGGIDLDGDRLLVGAHGEDTTMGGGAAYVFERDATGEWSLRERLLPTTPSYQFGISPALDGDSIAIGAPSEAIDGRRIGAVYSFDLSCFDCPADVDGDGLLTVFDFLTYLNLFQDGDALADFDGDGELTIFDFLAFQTAFDAGCG
jgi:hypothetical protein